MVDDRRRPRLPDRKLVEEQNKYQYQQTAPGPLLDAAHLYGSGGNSRPAETDRPAWHIHWPHLVFKHATKKERLVGFALIIILIISGSTGVYALNRNFKPSSNSAAQIAGKTGAVDTRSATETSRLTGAQITPELNKRPVTGVMIENSLDARPQSGLKEAGVVFEAIAEGGITRFMALYQEGLPDNIGPVRSVRPYYVDLLLPFDAALAHAGGSADGLVKVRNMGIKDLDHSSNAGAFRRSSDRIAPHNLYTSTAELDRASTARGYTASNVKSLSRKNEKPGQTVTARSIDLAMSSPAFNVHYDYDPGSNTYKRSQGSKPHTDAKSGEQLASKTVVTLVMNYSQSGIYSVYGTTGTGQAYIFQDGQFQAVTWTKANAHDQFTFTNAQGKPVPLNAGQTWVSLVKNPNAVKYLP